ncbi:MAG: hypothetical protein DWQ02_14425 [Bacteroidetes bacterium]|nr:MAG: hypothetical protein DWQ02_14425 [Bacteroidota bacterium]
MSNLTIDLKVVKKKGEDTSNERGYDLVVHENLSYVVIPEDNAFNKKWFPFKKKKIEVFAVTNHKRNKLNFKRTIPHADGIHSFYLKFKVIFSIIDSVEDKILVVKKLRSDPVKQVKQEIGSIFQRYFKQIEWPQLVEPKSFEKIRNNALESLITVGRDETIPIYDWLSDHANGLGIQLEEIDFDIEVPEEHLKVRIKEEEFDVEEKVKKMEIEKEKQVDQKEQELRIQRKLNKREEKGIDLLDLEREKLSDLKLRSIDQVVGNITSDISTINEAGEALKGISQLNKMMSGEKGDENPPFLGSGEGSLGLLGTGEESNFVSIFLEILNELKRANLERQAQKKILSILFHFIGLKLVPEEGKTPEQYANLLLQIELPKDIRDFIQMKWKELGDNIEKGKIL